MRTFTPFVILSAYRPESSEQTADRSDMLRRQIKALPSLTVPYPVNGHFAGHAEPSWLVFVNGGESNANFPDLLRLARRYSQDSVLYVDANRMAYLIDPRKPQFPSLVGRWVECAERPAGDHTELDGHYFATVR